MFVAPTNIYSFFEKKIFGMVVVLIHHLIVGLLPIAVAVFFPRHGFYIRAHQQKFRTKAWVLETEYTGV